MHAGKSYSILVVALVLAQTALGAAVLAQESSPEGAETVILIPRPNKGGKPRPPDKIVYWLPAKCAYVRGVVVAHPMIAELAIGARFRRVAADEGLGMLLSGEVFASSGK